MFTVAGITASSGALVLPADGVWSFRARLSSDIAPVIGARVAVLAGTLTLAGTVIESGTHANEAEVRVIGGAGGWRKDVPARAYRADNGVRLSQVAADLATDTGETVVLEPGAERVLGYAWSRLAGRASDALFELAGHAWWVAPDGLTHVGSRPGGGAVASPFTVDDFSPAMGMLWFTSPEDDFAALTVGDTLTGEGIGSFTIGWMHVRFDGSGARAVAGRA